MVILIEALNKYRDLSNTNLTQGDWGTGTATAFPSNTGLNTEVVGLEQSTTNSTADKALSITAVMPSTSGGTAVFAEHVIRFSDAVDLNRVVFSGITKSSSKEIHNITTLVFTNGNI